MFRFNDSAGKATVRSGQTRKKKRPTELKSRKLCDDTEAAVPAWIQSVSNGDNMSSRERPTVYSNRKLSAQVGVPVADAVTQSVSSADRTKESGDVLARVIAMEGAVLRRLEEMAVACVGRASEEDMRLEGIVGQLSRDVERVGRVVSAQQASIEQLSQHVGALATTLSEQFRQELEVLGATLRQGSRMFWSVRVVSWWQRRWNRYWDDRRR